MKHQRVRALLAIITVMGVALLATWVYLLPVGAGEFRDSPDGRFRAHATTFQRNTIGRGVVTYLEYRVEDRASERVIWQMRYTPPTADSFDYGDRSRRFVEWAGDSSSVTIALDPARSLTIPLPFAP